MIVRDAFKKFIRSRQQKGCSDQTIKSYECLTAHFIGFVGKDTEMEDLTQELLEDFLDFLYENRPPAGHCRKSSSIALPFKFRSQVGDSAASYILN